MENILIWIVFFAIAAIWEFVGKKKGGSQSCAVSGTPRSNNVGTTNSTVTQIRSSRPSSSKITPRPERTTTIYQAIQVSNDQPIQEVEILTDTPIFNQSADENSLSPNNDSPASQSDREAHFQRWRQAIIDTQILERKF